MRASLYLVGFAAASMMGIGLVEVGCSSSSTPATTPTNDAAAGDDVATGDDSGDDAAATPCTPVAPGTRVDTIDGGSAWACTQSMCNSKVLTACGGDCDCNNAVLGALQCIATDAGTVTACFTNAITKIPAGNANTTPLVSCLQSSAGPCAGIVIDGGTDAATDATAPTGDAGDAGTTSDASSDAAHE